MKMTKVELYSWVKSMQDAGHDIDIFSQGGGGAPRLYRFTVKDGGKEISPMLTLNEANVWFNGYRVGLKL